MKHKFCTALVLGAVLLPVAAGGQDNHSWTFDLSLYGLAAGMSGDVRVRGVTADLDVGFDDVFENLEFGGMGRVRIGRGDWALTTDVIYMGLGASRGPVSGDLDQWVVEPTLSYRLFKNFEALAGVRYNNLSVEIRGPFGNVPTGTQDWWDPIIGGVASLPIGERISLNVRGDAGGFGVGSDLTWQVFPYVNWRISRSCSLHAGYRWVYTDYETGSGTDTFGYDVLTQGPQVGLTLHL